MKIISLLISFYLLYYLEGIIFWIYLSGLVIFYGRVLSAFTMSDDNLKESEIDQILKICLKKWKISNWFESFLFFTFPILAVFKGWILVNKKNTISYGIFVNWIIIISLVLYVYIVGENLFLTALFLFIHLGGTILFSQYITEWIVVEENRLLIFVVYSLPLTYIFIFILNYVDTLITLRIEDT